MSKQFPLRIEYHFSYRDGIVPDPKDPLHEHTRPTNTAYIRRRFKIKAATIQALQPKSLNGYVTDYIWNFRDIRGQKNTSIVSGDWKIEGERHEVRKLFRWEARQIPRTGNDDTPPHVDGFFRDISPTWERAIRGRTGINEFGHPGGLPVTFSAKPGKYEVIEAEFNGEGDRTYDLYHIRFKPDGYFTRTRYLTVTREFIHKIFEPTTLPGRPEVKTPTLKVIKPKDNSL